MTNRIPTTDAESTKARELLAAAFDGYLGDHEEWQSRGRAADVPAAVAAEVESLCDGREGYRDAALTLLAFPAGNGTTYDVTDRFHNDRSTSDWLGRLLKEKSIRGVASALQNSSFRHSFVHEKIGSEHLRKILVWASDPSREPDEVRRVFDRIARRAAETAREVTPLPTLDATRFTFERALALTDAMLSESSEGACEQYTFAALKAAEVEAQDERLRVVTKNVRASDAGRTAGDVQVVRGQAEVVEAYEVTARPWDEKIVQAAEVVQQHGLPRVHVVGDAAGVTAAEIEEAVLQAQLPSTIDPAGLDLSAVDLRHEIRSLIARLTKSGRRRFVEHLWALLVQYNEDPHVIRLVEAVEALGLTASE